MQGHFIPRCSFSRTIIAWICFFLASSSFLGFAHLPDKSDLSARYAIETPAFSAEWVANTVQKSRSAHSFFDGFFVAPSTGNLVSARRCSYLLPSWDEAPYPSTAAAWPSPSLPRPPPVA